MRQMNIKAFKRDSFSTDKFLNSLSKERDREGERERGREGERERGREGERGRERESFHGTGTWVVILE